MKEPCDICRGSRIIRLPRYRPATAEYREPAEAVDIEDVSRTFPCPQCGPSTPQERVAFVSVGAQAALPRGIPADGFRDAARRDLAHRMIEELINGGFIKFEERVRELPYMPDVEQTAFRATMAAVAPAHVASIEERVKNGQMAILPRLAEQIANEINNWGSYFGTTIINKSDANRLIGEAQRRVERQIRNNEL